jgi:hypothetical protein
MMARRNTYGPTLVEHRRTVADVDALKRLQAETATGGKAES